MGNYKLNIQSQIILYIILDLLHDQLTYIFSAFFPLTICLKPCLCETLYQITDQIIFEKDNVNAILINVFVLKVENQWNDYELSRK